MGQVAHLPMPRRPAEPPKPGIAYNEARLRESGKLQARRPEWTDFDSKPGSQYIAVYAQSPAQSLTNSSC